MERTRYEAIVERGRRAACKDAHRSHADDGDEYLALENRRLGKGKTLGEWAREVFLREARLAAEASEELRCSPNSSAFSCC